MIEYTTFSIWIVQKTFYKDNKIAPSKVFDSQVARGYLSYANNENATWRETLCIFIYTSCHYHMVFHWLNFYTHTNTHSSAEVALKKFTFHKRFVCIQIMEDEIEKKIQPNAAESVEGLANIFIAVWLVMNTIKRGR